MASKICSLPCLSRSLTRAPAPASSAAGACAPPSLARVSYSFPLRSRHQHTDGNARHGQRSRVISYGRRGGKALQELASAREDAKLEAPDVTKLEWDSPLTIKSIVKYPDPRLRAPNGRIVTFDDDLKKLAAEMMDVMYLDDGVGLAAPQVGVNVQLMVFNPTGQRGAGQEYILCNPRIISTGKNKEVGEEGCLSFPNIVDGGLILGDVERPVMVKIKALDETGKKFQLKLEGWEARIFQHEYDHLLGKLFVDTDRMLASDREESHGELEALEKGFAESNPGTEVQIVR